MRKWIIIVLSFLLSSCKGQQKNETTTKYIKTQKEMNVEKFNIENFNKNKVNGEYNFVLNNIINVKQFGGTDNYVEYLIPIQPNLFGEYKEYYYPSGTLKKIISIFPNEFDLSSKTYDEKGILIEETNYDIPFKFNFEKILLLIENEKDSIDIFDRKNTKIGRSSDENGTFWFITYKKVPMRREVIKIDGITGQILERSFHPHEDN